MVWSQWLKLGVGDRNGQAERGERADVRCQKQLMRDSAKAFCQKRAGWALINGEMRAIKSSATSAMRAERPRRRHVHAGGHELRATFSTRAAAQMAWFPRGLPRGGGWRTGLESKHRSKTGWRSTVPRSSKVAHLNGGSVTRGKLVGAYFMRESATRQRSPWRQAQSKRCGLRAAGSE